MFLIDGLICILTVVCRVMSATLMVLLRVLKASRCRNSEGRLKWLAIMLSGEILVFFFMVLERERIMYGLLIILLIQVKKENNRLRMENSHLFKELDIINRRIRMGQGTVPNSLFRPSLVINTSISFLILSPFAVQANIQDPFCR